MPISDDNHCSERRRAWLELAGWLTAIAMPPLAWWCALRQGTPHDGAVFIGILAGTAAMWIFKLVPAFAPALFALLAVILFDIAPASVAAAGFASNGFFMLLSVFAIGALMAKSGLTRRVSLWMLRRVPAAPGWRQAGLCLYGLALTPLMPSQLGRSAIVAPFLAMLVEAGGKRRDAAALFASAVGGVSLAAAACLTGKPANLMAFGLFDSQTQFAFDWLPWLCAASLAGALLLAAHFAAMRLLFRDATPGMPVPPPLRQGEAPGPMSRMEWSALAAIGLILLGTLSAPYHRVDIPWLALAVLVALLLFGALRNEDLNQRVDWSSLIFVGAILSWAPIMDITGIDGQIAASLGGLGALMKSDLPAFLALLCPACVLLRLALPELVAEILLLTLLLPLAHAAGVSQWLIGFAVLTMCEAYQFPYQSPYHLYLDGQLAAPADYDRRLLLRYNLAMTLARALTLFASLPFWSWLNIV
ncbi:SLC13 family permease [Chromobacterium sp. CV08]|uniref:SLC13 family permease n=1 Tax=Chromobacterium sp. CV08 TaxID=3133274 RepID=UPI003DA7CB44